MAIIHILSVSKLANYVPVEYCIRFNLLKPLTVGAFMITCMPNTILMRL